VGNLAGTVPYSIGFRVNSKPTIEQFRAFPNPANQFVKFNLNIAGNTIPDEFRIELFNINGQKIAEFNQNTNPISLGNNEILWITNDLSTGQYVYKLTLRSQGQELPLDKFNESLSGKILIVR
jgi:hypothetical protein